MSSRTDQLDHNAREYAKKLEVFSALRQPVIDQVLAELDLPPGGHGLDLGCGIGLDLAGLLKAVGPGGSLTCADISPEMLVRARERAVAQGLDGAIHFERADVYHLPFGQASFDWLWSVDCAGMLPGPKDQLINDLYRILRPGGRLLLLAWSSQSLLPGYPELEARLSATQAGYAPFDPKDGTRSHFRWAASWLKQAGFERIETKTYLGQINWPLSSREKEAMYCLFDMRWGRSKDELNPDEWELFRRLSSPESEECILEKEGYHGFFSYTLFAGYKPSSIGAANLDFNI